MIIVRRDVIKLIDSELEAIKKDIGVDEYVMILLSIKAEIKRMQGEELV